MCLFSPEIFRTVLRLAHETLFGTGIPAHGWAKYVLGCAFILQFVYDAYWTTRLWKSFFRRAAALYIVLAVV